ncbi:hypothetical protein [Millisia brevis]|uniref:hypothetical protein n=1 Tax=Millisia brevis TaxID=264148 RepID=UPI00082C28DB|nr:hypothetical protein [Millisia brevis]
MPCRAVTLAVTFGNPDEGDFSEAAVSQFAVPVVAVPAGSTSDGPTSDGVAPVAFGGPEEQTRVRVAVVS